ncbi:MAG: DMT family transporter [Steroidobacteraceae bacterium]
MRPLTRARWQIHFCVVLWGFTAILGKLITLDAPALVVWRMAIVAGALLLAPRVWKALARLSPKLIAIYAGIGIVVALHWVTFYGAIKLANASVAASCLALAPVFLAIIEPWIAKRQHRPAELWLGVLVVPGVVLVVGGTPDNMNGGIAVGVLSAFFVAIFSALNKRFIHQADALTVTWIEMAAGALCLSAVLPLFGTPAPFAIPSASDAFYLLLLAFACTLLPFVMALGALRHLSAFETQLAVNLEPVYTILLAMLLFGEQHELERGFYAGVVIILAVVLLPTLKGAAHAEAPRGAD